MKRANTKKTEWVVRMLGWSGKSYTTVDEEGIRTYHPGTKFGWMDIKVFDNFSEADNWLLNLVRTKGGLITDFTIKKREVIA
ncbi:MAG: hypothetical protein LUD77_10355 [Clostridiales bacterium]|nr:hypothetical protein [Clostridiales bacterium]